MNDTIAYFIIAGIVMLAFAVMCYPGGDEDDKYDDIVGGMTNRQYLATLSNEELSNVIYDVIVDRIGYRYNSSKLGVAHWLGELYNENDFINRGL